MRRRRSVIQGVRRVVAEEDVELGTAIPARMRESDGTVYYVDKDHGSASDSNAGTSEAAPWATISKAFSGPAANGIVKVKKGATPYAAGVTSTRSLGSEANLVTVEAYNPADKPVISGKVQLNGGASYWRVRNLIADGTGVALGGSLFGADSSNHIEWYGCVAKNAPGEATPVGPGVQGFQPDNCSFLWWVNCVAQDGGNVDTRDHGWYVESGTDYYWLNCIAYGNCGYGWHCYNGTGTEAFARLYWFNCLSDDNFRNGVGRAGFILQSDHADGSVDTVKDAHYYNCLSTFHNDVGTDTTSRYGWRMRQARNHTQTSIDNWAGGYPKSSIESCLSYNNASGDKEFTSGGASEASVQTVSNFITGQNPLYVNQASRDYHLQAGSPAIGAGLADYTPPFDFAGNARTQADLGPYAA